MGTTQSKSEFDDFNANQLLMMCLSEDGKNLLTIEKNGFCKIISTNGNRCQRQLSLVPSCCSVSPRGGWLIGFESGTLSEFDLNLQLIQSFTKPGFSRAHKGSVASVSPVFGTSDKSDSLLCISAGEMTLTFWSWNGMSLHTMNASSPIQMTCLSKNILYMAQQKAIITIDINTKEVISVS